MYTICFVLVLCHINYCRLFNAKACFYIYIKYIAVGLVWFGLVLMANPFHTYIKYTISKHILLMIFLNKSGLIFYTVKWF